MPAAVLPFNGSVYTEPYVIHTNGSVFVLYGSVNTEHVLYTELDGSTAAVSVYFNMFPFLEHYGVKKILQ